MQIHFYLDSISIFILVPIKVSDLGIKNLLFFWSGGGLLEVISIRESCATVFQIIIKNLFELFRRTKSVQRTAISFDKNNKTYALRDCKLYWPLKFFEHVGLNTYGTNIKS